MGRAYTSIAAGSWTAEASWHAGGPTAGYCTPGMSQPITSTESGTGGGVRVTLTTAPDASTIWVAGDIAYIDGVTTGTEANGSWSTVNISGATFEIVPRKEVNWAAGGTQTAVRTSDSASSTVIGTTAVSGGIQLTLSGTATTWAVGDEVTVSGVLGTTNANGIWVVRAATNVTNSTIDLAVKFIAAGSGGAAVRGDTVTIRHAMTLASAVSIGHSPVTNADVCTVAHNGTTGTWTGTLTIQSGGILNLRGRLSGTGTNTGSAFVKVEPGGGVYLDSVYSCAAVRYSMRVTGTSDYFWWAGTSGGTRPYLISRNDAQPNVSGNPAALSGQVSSGFSGKPEFRASYADFTRLGSTSTLYAIAGPMYPTIDHCVFDGCGTINLSGLPADANCDITYTKFINSLDANLKVAAVNVAKTSGVWRFQYNVCDKGVGIACNSDFLINNIIMEDYFGSAGVLQSTALGLLEDSLFVFPYATSGSGVYQRINNCYVLLYKQARNLRAFVSPSTLGDIDSNTPVFDNLIFDAPNASSILYSGGPPSNDGDSGDLIQTPSSNPALAVTTTIRNSIGLPISSGHSAESYASRGCYPGTMFTGRGFSNVLMRAINNTWHSYDLSATRGSHGGINVAESTTSIANTVTALYNNLCWSSVTSGVPIYLDTSVTVNAVVPANCHHNASHNLIVHSQSGDNNGKHYFGVASGGTIGANDLTNVDPQFVDKDRCIVKWFRLLAGDLGTGVWSGGKRADETDTDEDILTAGLVQMRKMLDSDFDPRYTVAALQAYVRSGFKPTNATYQNSDLAGTGAIGAVNGQFASDWWDDLGAAESIVGRTASDGVSHWTAHGGNFIGTGTGAVYSATGKFIGQLVSIDDQVATKTNQDITWTWKPTATPLLTGGAWQTAVAAKIRNAQYTHCLYVVLEATSGSGGQIGMVENNAIGGFARYATPSSIFTTLTSDIVCTLSIRAGVATLTCTGGFTFTTSLELSTTASGFGGIGLMAYNPVSGGVTLTQGVHTGPITGVDYLGDATAYDVLPAYETFMTTPMQYASKYPSAFYIYNANVGNRDTGYDGNRLLSLCLDGVAPAGGFLFTPSGWTLNDATGVSQTTIAIPAGADAYEFALKPPAGQIVDYLATGTNNLAFSDPSHTVNCRPNLCMWEGDSYSDRAFGAVWPAAVRTALGTTWLFQTSAAAFSKLDDGTSVASLNIKVRQAITVEPFHDQTRTKEAYGIWGGTNDLFGTDSGATAFAKLQVCVNNAKTAGVLNIAVGTITARQADVGIGGPGQSVFETRRQDFNTLVKAAYGATGTDPTVKVLDFGGDAVLGTSTVWSDTAYFPDATHPTGASATPIIQGYITTWLASVPDNGAGGVLRSFGFEAGFSNMTGGYQ